MWDVGGQDKIRPLWRHYYQNTQGVIFVVDSNDQARFPEAREELRKMMAEEELRNALLLVFANKQDLPNAASTAEVVDALGLPDLRGCAWYIMSCCGTTGAGLYEGLDWLADKLKEVWKAFIILSCSPFWNLPIAAIHCLKILFSRTSTSLKILPAPFWFRTCSESISFSAPDSFCRADTVVKCNIYCN